MLKEGTKAPDFALCDKDGKTVTLQDFAGKKLVLYFYPKDNTAGCTKQACAFAAVYEGFKDKGLPPGGISDRRIELAVGECTGAALSELRIGVRVRNTAVP